MTERPTPRVAVGGVVLERSADNSFVVVLLIRRGRPPMEGRWSLPGGRVEPGERLEEAVRREILEEAGLEVRVGPLVEVIEIIDEVHHYVILDYVCERVGGELRAGDDASDAAMVAVDDLPSYGVSEAVLRVVQAATRLRGQGG